MWTAIFALSSTYSSSGAWLGEPPHRRGDAAGLTATAETGLVPPFRAQERDRLQLGGALTWSPSDGVALGLSYPVQALFFEDGSRSLGSGDVRIDASARVLDGPVELWVDHRVKLPNAPDEQQLGTDELDWEGRCWVGWNGPLRLDAAVGLAILGDPNRFAAQDDAALVDLRIGGALRSVDLWVAGGGRLPSPRNPASLRASAGLGWGGPVLLGGDLSAGLTPAAPDLALRAWAGLVF